MRYLVLAVLLFVSACSVGADPDVTPSVGAATLGTSAGPSTVVPSAATSTPAPSPVTSASGPAPTTTVAAELATLQGLVLAEVASVGFPVDVVSTGTDDRLFVVDKTGMVAVIQDGAAETYIDLRGEVSGGLEQGLLGMVFAPDFSDSGRLFVSYTDANGDTVIAEYRDEGGNPQRVSDLLKVGQPASNHNGGSMVFDEAGFLYVGLGDGGGANDRFLNGQNPDSLLGSILRIDIDTGGGVTGNPYLNGGGAPEIWAIGTRNPWRLSIDGETLIVPDVGQNAYEEISLVPLTSDTPNLGWPRFEGLHCFDASAGCSDAGLIMPVVEVPHGDSGTCSITGGVVYRGSAIPEWDGRYFYSDFCGGYLRSVSFEDGKAVDHVDWTEEIGGALGQVVVVGAGPGGELHIGTSSGRVFRVDPLR